MPDKARIRVSIILSGRDPLLRILDTLPPARRGRAVRLFLLERLEEFQAHVQAMARQTSGPAPEAAPESPRPSPRLSPGPARPAPGGPRGNKEGKGVGGEEDEALRMLLGGLEE